MKNINIPLKFAFDYLNSNVSKYNKDYNRHPTTAVKGFSGSIDPVFLFLYL